MTIDDRERERRRTLLRAHYAAENEHDLERIMATFAKDGTMLYNRGDLVDGESIRWAHADIGLSAERGAFVGVENVIDAEHFTADEIIVEGRLRGKHGGEFLGFTPTERDVELPFVAFYRFDEKG